MMHSPTMPMVLALGALTSAAAGCTPDRVEALEAALPRSAREAASPALTRVESCDAVLADLKDRLVADMEARLQENLERALTLATHGCEYWAFAEADGTGGYRPAPPAAESASEYSETNVQVEGVDEADFVKNDGGYLYVLADGRFQILDAWPASATHRVASLAIEGEPRRMYVHDDTAVIYSSLEPIGPGGGVECTYGYDCEFTGDGRRLKITVLDIADRRHPRLVRELSFDGAYLASRRVGQAVHTAVVSPELTVPGLSYWPAEIDADAQSCFAEEYAQPDLSPAEIEQLFAALRQTNLELIAAAPASAILPNVRDVRHGDGAPAIEAGPLTACDDLRVAPTGLGRSFVSLVSFALDRRDPLGAVTVLSRPGAVYASADSMLLAVRHDAADGLLVPGEDATEATAVHKFVLAPAGAAAEYAASGAVAGRVLNQFAMDEHDGVLRLATTSGYLPSPDVRSAVTTLIEQGSRLQQLGRVDGLAPGEDIRAVRFDGDLAYVVTFKKTDPLFVLDLSDPRAPQVQGELKIPGFSTYIHRMDDAHLLTIGYDADEQGDFAWFQGVQLQVIDVADLAHPALAHKEVIGTRGSTSDAATDHLAFTYFKARDLLAVPMTICEGGGGGDYGDLMTFSGLLVYRVTAADGFDLLGGVPHLQPETPHTYSGQCNNWWTRPNSLVKRSVFLEDWVFSIAPERVNVAHLDDLAHPAASISLDQP